MGDVYQARRIARHSVPDPRVGIAASVICGESLPAAPPGGAGRRWSRCITKDAVDLAV